MLIVLGMRLQVRCTNLSLLAFLLRAMRLNISFVHANTRRSTKALDNGIGSSLAFLIVQLSIRQNAHRQKCGDLGQNLTLASAGQRWPANCDILKVRIASNLCMEFVMQHKL
jgi:hypothetical protein